MFPRMDFIFFVVFLCALTSEAGNLYANARVGLSTGGTALGMAFKSNSRFKKNMSFIERLEIEFAHNYLKIHELIDKWQDTLERSRPSNLRFLDYLTTTLAYASTLLYGDLTDFKKMLDSYVAPAEGEPDVQLDALISIWESITPHVRVVEAAFHNIYKLL